MKESETDPVYMEALEWFVMMKDEQAGAEDRRAFAAWMAADPAHRAAYERARSLWDRFDIVKPEYEKMRDPRQLGRRGFLLGGIAAMMAAPFAYWATRPGAFADHVTGIGERRSFTLADGSMVELGSYSALSVDFTERERRLVLHRGQGFFQAAADALRPFVVAAGAGAARALGTRFDVKLADDRVSVTVMEHAVSVELAAQPPVTIDEGWQVTYGANRFETPRQVDIASVTAWRGDRIVFEDAPLRLVLQELERYRRGRIVLMDDSVGNIPVTAIFDTRQANAALATIAETLPIRVLDAVGYMALVYRR